MSSNSSSDGLKSDCGYLEEESRLRDGRVGFEIWPLKETWMHLEASGRKKKRERLEDCEA